MLAVAVGLVHALRLSGRRVGVVLVYHALGPVGGDPRREVVPAHAMAAFEGQLRHLRRWFRVVPASAIVVAVGERRRGGRFPVAVTFDDDLPTHVELAAPTLQREGVPATFFLTGASLEAPFSFWWQRLQRAVDAGMTASLDLTGGIQELAARIEEMPAAERRSVADRLRAALGPDPEGDGLRAAHVRQLVADGFDIGFHTLHHDRLTSLDDAALADALVEGRETLSAAASRPVTSIAYPHGKGDARVATSASRSGYRLGFTGSYEPVRPETDPLLIGRVEPTLGSLGRFALQLARLLAARPHR